MLTYLGFGILPKHIFEQTPIKDMKENPANFEPIGSGPYKFVEWVRGQHIILEANEDYYGEGPYIEQVIIKFYQDEQVMLAALEKGDIDYMGSIPPDDIERVKAEHSDRLDFVEVPANGYTYIGLKQTHPILSDKRVRKALMYGLNRQAIVDDILLGYGTVMNANIPPVSWAYAEGELEPYEYNPEKAKQLLEEAGWVEGPDGIRVKDGQRLSFTLVTDSGSKQYESIIMLVQEDWEKIGVEMKPEFLEWSVLCSQYLDVAKFEATCLAGALGSTPTSTSSSTLSPVWTQKATCVASTTLSSPTLKSMNCSNGDARRWTRKSVGKSTWRPRRSSTTNFPTCSYLQGTTLLL